MLLKILATFQEFFFFKRDHLCILTDYPSTEYVPSLLPEFSESWISNKEMKEIL